MSKLDEAIYRFLRSLLICLVLVSLLLIFAVTTADFLNTNVYEGEVPYWVRFFGLSVFVLLLLCIVLMTIGRTGKEFDVEHKKQNKGGVQRRETENVNKE